MDPRKESVPFSKSTLSPTDYLWPCHVPIPAQSGPKCLATWGCYPFVVELQTHSPYFFLGSSCFSHCLNKLIQVKLVEQCLTHSELPIISAVTTRSPAYPRKSMFCTQDSANMEWKIFGGKKLGSVLSLYRLIFSPCHYSVSNTV
jgi:hypothetical protein